MTTTTSDLATRSPICPKCSTRVCMTFVCNPPAPTTIEEHKAEVSRSARHLADVTARLEAARAAARVAESRLADAFARNDEHDIVARGLDAERAWQGVERVNGYWQSSVIADLHTRTAAHAAGVAVAC